MSAHRSLQGLSRRAHVERQTELDLRGPLSRPTAPRRRTALPAHAEVSTAASVPIVEGRSEKVFRDYQREGAEYLRSRRRCLLSDEVGLGKSAQWLRSLPPRARAIVVCPKYLRLVWVDECREWRRDLEPEVTAELRAPEPGELLVMHYEALPPPAPGARRTLRPDLDLSEVRLAVDEATYVKNPDARRTQRLVMLIRQVYSAVAITGTPLLGAPDDLAGVLEAFDLFEEAYGGHRLGEIATPAELAELEASGADMDRAVLRRVSARRYFDWAFKAFMMPVERARTESRGGVLVEVEPRRGKKYGSKPRMPAAADGLARVMLRRLRREHLDLPPVIERVLRVPAPDDLRAELDEALGAWRSWGDPDELPPFELLSAALAKLAEARIPHAIEHCRIAVREGPMLAFSAFREPVIQLAAALGPRAGLITGSVKVSERKRLVDLFQAGGLDLLCGTVDSMGMGLTLTRAGRVLMIDESYTPSENEQAVGRVLRHGQEASVLVERMLTDHPLDVRRAEILRRKQRLIDAVVGT